MKTLSFSLFVYTATSKCYFGDLSITVRMILKCLLKKWILSCVFGVGLGAGSAGSCDHDEEFYNQFSTKLMDIMCKVCIFIFNL